MNKGAVIKEVPLTLLMAPQTAVSTGRSYPSTLGKSGVVENECILLGGAGVARTRHLYGCLSCWGPALASQLSGERDGEESQEGMVSFLQEHGSVIQLEKENQRKKNLTKGV